MNDSPQAALDIEERLTQLEDEAARLVAEVERLEKCIAELERQ